MAIGPVAGQVIDLYREHVTANAPTYSGTVRDDFHYNAVRSETPYSTANSATTSAYNNPAPGTVNGGVWNGVQIKADSWIMQLRQQMVQQ